MGLGVIGRVRTQRGGTTLKAKADGILGNVIAFMDKHVDDVVDEMRFEPAPKQGSRYVRTHTYRDEWHRDPGVKFTREGIVARVYNDATSPYGAHYAVFVGGDETGKRQDTSGRLAHGWPLFAEVLRKGFNEGVKKAVHDAL